MKKLNHRQKIILGTIAGLIGLTTITMLVWTLIIGKKAPVSTPDYWPTTGWQSKPPEQGGLDSAKLAQGLLEVKQSQIPIHSLMIIINGYAVVDATFYPYDGKAPHSLGSINKALITTLIGIATAQGKLSPDQTMVSFFPGYTISNRDARKDQITVQDLLTMSSGMECTGLPTESTQREMESSPNWVQFALDRPMVNTPGSTFVYCGPDMHLLSAILQVATGMTALEFGQQYLFEPLGFKSVLWPTDPQGVNQGAGNVRLFPADMAKLGFLYLHRGQWEGKQIISSAWVKDALRPQGASSGDPYGYGWRSNKGDLGYEFYAEGMGGQRILVIPGLNTILVTTGGGFDIDQLIPFLTPALVDLGHTLPPNPSGAQQLKAMLDELAQPPEPRAAAAFPEITQFISGKNIMMEQNPLQMKSLRLEFHGNNDAAVQFTFDGNIQSPLATIGLDGNFRNTPGVGLDRALRSSLEIENQPVGLRGAWTDAQTFSLEYDTLTNRYVYWMKMHFEGNLVKMDISELVYGDHITLTGVIQNP